MLKFHDNRNQSINKQIADLVLANYNKGLKVRLDEEQASDDEPEEITTIAPITKQVTKKGYSVKNKVNATKATMKVNADTIKEFIKDSNLLDNELNAMVTLFKLTSKDEFYETGLPASRVQSFNDIRNGRDARQFMAEEEEESDGDSTYQASEASSDDEDDDDEVSSVATSGTEDTDDRQRFQLFTELQEKGLPVNNENIKAYLREHNIPIIKHRSNALGEQGKLKKDTEESLMDSYLRKSKNKAKKGVIVDNDVDMKRFNNDLVLQIKRIHHIITNLLPIAQNLLENHFAGATHSDINKLKDLYEDMDEKMYILTSMNHQSTQLVKLDNDFELLYNRVNGGITNYQPMTGGSISMLGNLPIVHPNKHSVKTEFLHAL